MRILLTGATSFTGMWFVRALVTAGHHVVATSHNAAENYQGVRARRAAEVARIAQARFGVPFGHDILLDLINDQKQIDIYCHHAAVSSGRHRSDFDPIRALEQNVFRLYHVLEALRHVGCRGVVLTGTVYEAGTGAGDAPECAIGAYGLSKTMTTQMMRHACHDIGLPMGRFVIPNPFGPWDEFRFVEYLIRQWQKGECATVRTPYLVRDNIPVDLLAMCYERFVTAMGKEPGDRQHLPSGYVESQGDFALRVAQEMSRRLGIRCPVDLDHPQASREPRMRINTEPVMGVGLTWSEHVAWDRLADYVNKYGSDDDHA